MTDMRDLIETVTLSENADPIEGITAQIDALLEKLHEAVWEETVRNTVALSLRWPGAYVWVCCINNTDMINMYPPAGEEPDSIEDAADDMDTSVFGRSDEMESYGISLDGEVIAVDGRIVDRRALRQHAEALPGKFMAMGRYGRASYCNVSG